MIDFHRFSFAYSGQDEPALSDIDLHFGDGERVLLTGASGCGKTTLCRCLNGLIPHFHGGLLQGRVVVEGCDITRCQPREFALRVDMVFQDPENQIVGTDVERDIAFGLENLGVAPATIARRVDEVLTTLGILSLRRRPIAQLSGGEKQKVALAACLALRPAVLVLDEPTSELDPVAAEELMQLLARLRQEYGMTMILAEHRVGRVLDHVQRVVVLDRGQVVRDGDAYAVMVSAAGAPRGVEVPAFVHLAARLGPSGNRPGVTPLDAAHIASQLASRLRTAAPTQDDATAPSRGTSLVRLEDVSFSYEQGLPVLQHVSTELYEGQLVAVMGRNGAGKTTFARHLNGLLRPTSGRVCVCGHDTRSTAVPELARHVGLVFQNPNDHLFADTVEDELRFTLKHLGVASPVADGRIDRTLELLDLERFRRSYPRDLSGGERQRVALASVVAAEPRVLVLDEPTRGLEHGLKQELMRFLERYCALGRLVVIITHDVETVAQHAHRVILLQEGRIVADGATRAVLAQSEDFRPEVARLLQPFCRPEMLQRYLTLDDVLGAVG